MPRIPELPLGRRIVLGLLVAVSITVTTDATSYPSAASSGRWLITKTDLPSGVIAAANGSRVQGTRAISFLAARSITDTSLSKRLHT